MSSKDNDGHPSGISIPANTYGYWGDSDANEGVVGTSGSGIGVWGKSADGPGVRGEGRVTPGVVGASETFGVHGYGTADGGIGVIGEGGGTRDTGIGVRGTHVNGTGVLGSSANGTGVDGESTDGIGIFGHSDNGVGIRGASKNSIGISGFSTNFSGVTGESQQGSTTEAGVSGVSSGLNSNGVIGEANNGPSAFGVWGKSTNGFAGFFTGTVRVHGSLFKDGGGFKIDHPVDPANKYLNHSFVESSDMKNVYDGVAILDAQGEAAVELPEWFEALNQDFRYQLTAIGAPGPNLYIAEEISQNHFKIAGGTPNLKVSWQVTGIRQDAWAKANPIPVEQDKPAQEHDFYQHPELYGESEQKSIEHALGKVLKGP